jgi:hypothetical protein
MKFGYNLPAPENFLNIVLFKYPAHGKAKMKFNSYLSTSCGMMSWFSTLLHLIVERGSIQYVQKPTHLFIVSGTLKFGFITILYVVDTTTT